MNPLYTTIEKLIKIEMQEAQKNHPPYHSQHEAYALLKEEIEECETELNRLKEKLEFFWQETKADVDAEPVADEIVGIAKFLILEAAQVAVVARRFVKKE